MLGPSVGSHYIEYIDSIYGSNNIKLTLCLIKHNAVDTWGSGGVAQKNAEGVQEEFGLDTSV